MEGSVRQKSGTASVGVTSTSPEIVRLAVMMDVRYPFSLRNGENLLHGRALIHAGAGEFQSFSWFA